MSKALKTVCAGLLLLYSATCSAQQGKADEQLVKQVMQKSGLSKQIEQFPSMIQADIIRANQESSDKLSQSEINDLSNKVAESFNARKLNDTVQMHIQENLPEKDIRAVLEWLSSPLGERISMLEEQASKLEAYKGIREMAGRIDKNSERTKLLSKLDNARKATDVGVSLTINLQVAFILAVTAGMPAEQRPSVEAILAEVNEDRQQLQKSIRQETLAGFLYTYRSLKDAEIEQYIAFAESEAGKKYHVVTAEGLNTAVMQASLALGSKLSQGLDKEGRSSF